jgi:hypothetical protein
MQTVRMNASVRSAFLEALKRWGTLVASVERSPGVFSLKEIVLVNGVRPDALNTILAFKKLLLKPRFAMFEKVGGEQVRESGDNDGGPAVIARLVAVPQRHATVHSLSLAGSLRWIALAYPAMAVIRYRFWGIEVERLALVEELSAPVATAVGEVAMEIFGAAASLVTSVGAPE